MTRFGLVHSPAGPGPIIRVQVHPYLDLDPDIWGPPGPGLDFGQSIDTHVLEDKGRHIWGKTMNHQPSCIMFNVPICITVKIWHPWLQSNHTQQSHLTTFLSFFKKRRPHYLDHDGKMVLQVLPWIWLWKHMMIPYLNERRQIVSKANKDIQELPSANPGNSNLAM